MTDHSAYDRPRIGDELGRDANSRPRATVAVGRDDCDIARALTTALAGAGIDHALGRAARRRKARVVVKPVLPPIGAETDPVGRRVRKDPYRSYADPAIVQSLVDWLNDHGWHDVTILVCEEATARRVGYTLPVVELTADTVDFQYGGLIGQHLICKQWRDAQVRVLVGTARTDRQLTFGGVITSALGCVPDSEVLSKAQVTGHEMARCANDILESRPVTFGVVDAWRAGARGAGGAASKRTILASSDLLALDWVLAELMGLDGPQFSPMVREAVLRRGVIDIDRRGDLTEWEGWPTPSMAVAALTEAAAGRWWARLAGWREVPWIAR